jgi:hypothetical protein
MNLSGTSPIRRRRTKAEMNAIRSAIVQTLAAEQPMTVRQVFYALTTQSVIAKTEAEYKGTVCRLLAEMRRSGEIPYTWLADATRWMRRPRTFSSTEDALRRTAETYRRALWDDAPVAVEVWLEKEALAGVLVEVTDEWDVPLMVTRGYPSMSFLYSAAQAIGQRQGNGQRTQIYYFGDRDPSGVDIDRAVQQGIGEGLESMLARRDVPNTDFERVAVTAEQITAWDLPARPTKKSDTRSKNFEGESVELDAIPPARLRELAEQVIDRHVDHQQLEVLRTYEDEERRQMEQIAATLDGGG